MALDKFAGLFGASAKSMASSARSIEHFAEVMESQMETQNALLITLVDKLDKVAAKRSKKENIGLDSKGGTSLKDTVTSLGEITKILPKLIKGLIKFPKKSGIKFIDFARNLSEVIESTEAAKYEGFSDVMAVLSIGISKMAKGLFLFGFLVSEKTIDKFIGFIKKFTKELTKIKSQKLDKGAQSIEKMGRTIAMFGLTMLIASMAYAIIGPIAALTIIPVIAGFAYVFVKIGEAEKEIKKGAKSIAWMSLAIIGMGTAMLMTMQLAGGSWGAFAKGTMFIIAGIVVFGLVFNFLGGIENNIEKGAKAVAWMGLGIISLGLGLALWQAMDIDAITILKAGMGILVVGLALSLVGNFSDNIKDGSQALIWSGLGLSSLAFGIWIFQILNINASSVLIAGLAVFAVGLALGLVGIFDKQIEKGAVALIFSGLGLASLAGGIWVFKMLDISVGDILTTGLAVLTIGLLFGIAGSFAGLIALGSLVMIGSAIGLIAIGYGYAQFKENNIDLSDIGLIAGAVVSIGAIFSGAGLLSWLIIPGGIAMIAAGIALSSLTKGLTDFKDIKFEETDADKLSYVVQSVVAAFAASGGGVSFMGIPLGVNRTSAGIEAVMNAGKALSSISKGLIKFRALKLSKAEANDLWGDEGSIIMTIAGISSAFGAIGSPSNSRDAKGLLGWIGIERNSVEEGIDAVMNVSKALIDIAKGITAIRKLGLTKKEADDIFGPDGSIRVILDGVNIAFAAIGGQNKETKGLLGWIGVERNSVEDGINAVKDVGSILVNLAAGVQEFANLTFTDPITGKKISLSGGTLKKVGENIAMVVTAVSDVFGRVGSKSADASGIAGFFGARNNETKEGIDAVKGIGSELLAIAESVQKFATMTFIDPVTGKAVTMNATMFGPDGAITKNISMVVTAVSDVFGKIGAGSSDASGIAGFFGARDNKTQEGIDAVTGMGTVLNEIATGVQKYAELQDMTKIKKNILDILTFIPKIFLASYTLYLQKLDEADAWDVFERFSDSISDMGDAMSKVPSEADAKEISIVKFVQDLAKEVDPLSKLADSFEKLADNMDSFVKAYKGMDIKSMEKHKLLIDSLVVFSEVDPNALDRTSDRGKQLLDYINSGGPTPPQKSTAVEAAPTSGTKQKGTKDVKGKESDKAANVEKIDLSVMEDALAGIKTQLVQINTKLAGTITTKERL